MSVKYRSEIDGLRAIAILSVLIFHAFPSALPGGLVGVDVFFVISGYLITGILIQNPKLTPTVLSNFYARRVRRIFPALIITLLLTYGFAYFALYSDDFKVLGLDIASGATFLANIRYLNGLGYFDTEAVFRPLLHLWSLGVEEQYYLIWPLIIFSIVKSRYTLAIIWALIIISFALNVYYSYTHVMWSYYLPFTRFWELFAGGLLAVQEQKGEMPKHDKLSLFGLILLVVACVFVDGDDHFPGWQAVLPVYATYLIIRHTELGIVKKILSNKGLVGIGLISYPLYLYHWPLFTYAKITEINPSSASIMVLTLLAIILAILTYKYVERPIRKTGKGWTIGLLIGMLIIAIFGASAYQRDGLDFREVKYQLYKQDIKNFFMHHEQAKHYQADMEFKEPPSEYLQALEKLASHLKNNAFRKKQEEAFKTVNDEEHMCSSGDCEKTSGNLKKVVVIIGDSHGDNAYMAIKMTHPDLELHPFLGPGCFPIMKRYPDPASRCAVTLKNARDFVQKNKPDMVILASRWVDYYQPVLEDIQFYRQYTDHIALIGPSVRFNTHVKRFLSRYDGESNIQNYINSYLSRDKFRLNEEMRDFAKEQGVSFIDKIRAFCGDGYCKITKTGEELYIPDKGHLNPSGVAMWSNYLYKNKEIYSILEK